MKKLSLFVSGLLSLLICFSSIAATIPDELPLGTLNTKSTLYKNTTDKSSIGSLKKGKEVEIIGEAKITTV